MTSFTVPRGQFRAMLSATQPHTGVESDATPTLGRVRFHPEPLHLLAWATDHITAVVSRIDIEDQLDAELEDFDLSAASIKAALAVFKAPGGVDAKMMWDDQDLRVEVTREHVVFTEQGSLIDGRSLQVNRIVPANAADHYPDVPRDLVDILNGAPVDHPTARVQADHLARFQPAGRAFDTPVRLHLVGDPASVLVRIGRRLIGKLPAYPLTSKDRLEDLPDLQTWQDTLVPLRRPERVDVPADVVEELRDQAAELLRNGTGVHLTVVKAGDPT